MSYDALRAEAETVHVVALPDVSKRMWALYGAGGLTDDQAEALDAVIRSRQEGQSGSRTAVVQIGATKSLFPPKRRQQAPERSALIERRRASAAAGWMPPALAKRFTVSEQSVLAVVAREITQKGACDLCVDAIAALAGVSRRMVQSALRLAHDTALILIEERRRKGNRNLPNRITMLSREWQAWTKRRGGSGCKSSHPMSSDIHKPRTVEPVRTGNRAAEGQGRARGARSGDSQQGPVRGVKAMR